MPNRKRWYAELAGTILLWVEEEPDNPVYPWRGYVLRRPQVLESAEGPVQLAPPLGDTFTEKSERAAIESVESTIQNHRAFQEYGHRVKELNWKQWELSEEDWKKHCKSFVAGEQTD